MRFLRTRSGGWVLWDVLRYLEERGVDLTHSEYEAEADAINEVFSGTYLITTAHKVHLPALDVGQHDARAMADYVTANGYGFEEADEACVDGLVALREQISALTDEQILVLHIG
jgi:hypothetical protein